MDASNELGNEYSNLTDDLSWHRNWQIKLPERFQPITSRKDTTILDLKQMKAVARGKYFSQYRGFAMLKSPLDISLYSQMFQELQPKTIIEFGTYIGSSALWMDDLLQLFDIDCKIFSFDKYVSLRDERINKLVSKQVTFIEADSNNVVEEFPPSFFKDLPRPMLVFEDAHENVNGILKHFHNFMNIGDYFIVEDTNPLVSRDIYVGEQDPNIYREGSMIKRDYTEYGNWKLHIVREFCSQYDGFYAVDTFFSDLFGDNGSSQMNSILRKMK